MNNQPSVATKDALERLDRLKRRIQKFKQLGSSKDRAAARLIDEGISELREHVLELDRLAVARASPQGPEAEQNTESMSDKVFKTWGQHEAINIGKDRLPDAWDALKDLIAYLLN